MEDRLLEIFRQYEEGKCSVRINKSQQTQKVMVEQVESQMPVDTEWKDLYEDKPIIVRE